MNLTSTLRVCLHFAVKTRLVIMSLVFAVHTDTQKGKYNIRKFHSVHLADKKMVKQ